MILRKMLSKIIDSIRISSEFFFIYEKFLMRLGKILFTEYVDRIGFITDSG